MGHSDSEYLTIAQAARLVGVSTATLRRWDADGRLPAVRRPNSTYRYYRVSDLERVRLEYGHADASKHVVAGFFDRASPTIHRNPQLREPQREAYEAALEHFKKSEEPAIIQLPVGCGKTGVAALLPFGLCSTRTLVVAPNTTIREGLYAELNISNVTCFWKRMGILDSFTSGPFAALVDGPRANLDDCLRSHIVVANVQQLASSTDRWLSQFPADFFDLIIVDEGHHVAAASWQKVVRAFPNARVVSLTATPFRADNAELLGEVIYTYPFARAMLNGYVKHLVSASAHPAEITFTTRDETTTYSLGEILELRDEAWFRRGVALSEECNRHIAAKAVEKLRDLRRATGFPHQIVASAMSIDHANQIRAIFEEASLQAATIHSRMPDEQKDSVLAKLRSSQIDCIVQVAMLGEGFDHPPLSVAAIFRPYRTLSPYVQFVGRVMRTVAPNDPQSPDNEGFVVSHAGLNNEARWEDFRELDAADQELVRQWTEGTSESTSRQGGDRPEPAVRFDGPVAADERISHFLTQSFIDPDDDRQIEQLLDDPGPGGFTLREFGVTPAQLRERLVAREARAEEAAELPDVQPQVRRQTLRSRLNSRSKSVHHRILTELGLARAGFDISRAVARARGNNADALYALLNAEINGYAGQQKASRDTWTAEELQVAYEALDDIGDEVAAMLRQELEDER